VCQSSSPFIVLSFSSSTRFLAIPLDGPRAKRMKVVIQCAGRKQQHAGYLRTRTRQRVKFVAHPEQAPSTSLPAAILAQPDARTSRRSTMLASGP
jgi:hypothetical protein